MVSRTWIRRLFTQKKPAPIVRAKSSKKASLPLHIEDLEMRQMLTVSGGFSGGIVTFTDNGANITDLKVGQINVSGSDYVVGYDGSTNITISGGTSISTPGGSISGVLLSSVNSVTYAGTSNLNNETVTLQGGTVGGNTLTSYTKSSNVFVGGAVNTATGGTGGIQTLHVSSNNTNSTFTVGNTNVSIAGQSSTTYSSFGTVTLTGGTGGDIFDVTTYTAPAPRQLAIDGGAGTNRITSTGDVSYTLSNTQLGRTSQQGISLTNINQASLTGGAGNNLFNVTGYTGGGTLNGAGGVDTLISANGAFTTVTLADASLAQDSQNFSLSGFSNANLSTLGVNTTFNLNGWTGAANISATGANTTLAGPNGVQIPNQWNFTGIGNGTINANLAPKTINFTGIKNMVGGSNGVNTVNQNTFKFAAGSSVPGTVTGAGNDVLDYSSYGSPVSINFGTRAATAIFNGANAGFSGISGFVGTGNDTFTGPNAGFNTFNINGNGSGNDIVTGVGTFTFSGVASLNGGTLGNAFNYTSNASYLGGNIAGVGNDNLSFAGYKVGGVSIQITNEGTNNSLANGTFIGYSGKPSNTVLGGSFSGIKNLAGTGLTGASGDSLIGANGAAVFHGFQITGNDSGIYGVGNQSYPGNLSYSGIANLRGGNDVGDRFSFFPGGTVSGSVGGGLAGSGGVLDYSNLSTAVNVTLTTLRDGTATNVGTGFTNIRQLRGQAATPQNVFLTGPSTFGPLTWNITASNSGNVTNGPTSFDYPNVGNLIGGSANDTFNFSNNTGISGVLNGGGGFDTANYSLVTANLTIDTSTKVLNFESIIGGTGSDTLIGANGANIYNMNGVNAGTLNANTSFSSIENLRGNVGGDVFGFSTGGSLSGSITGFGNNVEKLDFSNVACGPVTIALTNVENGNGTVAGRIGGTFTGIHALQGQGNNVVAGSTTLKSPDDSNYFFTWGIGSNGSAFVGNDAGYMVSYKISGNGTGYKFPLFQWAGIANLQGGTAIDYFSFAQSANILGTVDGGNGPFNTLDFQASTGNIAVNLENRSATPILGGANSGFANISSFLANYGNSVLTARNVDNSWVIFGNGNGTINLATDGVRFNAFSNLNGGTANDTFTMSADNAAIPKPGSVSGHLWGGSNNISIEPNNGSNASGHDVLAYDTAYRNATANAPISVNPSAGTATGIAGGIASIDAFSIAGNNNSLFGGNGNNVWEVFDQNAGTLNGVGFAGFQNLIGGTGTDLFHFSQGATTVGSVDGKIEGGSGNAVNELSYLGANYAVAVNLQDSSATHINGANATGFANISVFTGSGNVALGSLLTGKNVNSTWNFGGTDSGTVSNDSGTNNPYSATFSGFSTLRGGSANDTFVPATNVVPAPAIDGGQGNNTLTFADFTSDVNVVLGTGYGQVSNITHLIGGIGNDSLTGDSAANGVGGHYFWHLRQAPTESFVTDMANDNAMYFSSFESLTGSSDDDTFFFGPGSSVSGTLNGGAGNNTLDFGTDNFGVPIELDLGAGTITALSGPQPVGFLDANTFAALVGSGVGGTSGDTIVGFNGNDNVWFLVGQDAGTIAQDRNFAFTGVANLRGGDGNDTFGFGSNSQITGTIDGEGGNNTLDYHLYTTPVAVDLANSSASHIFGGANDGFANISALTGTFIQGKSGDTLTGYTGDQVFNITGNDSGSTGEGFTFVGVANLHGNDGNDTFVFGEGSSISGSVDGEGGSNNALDYSGFNASVVVDLANHSATGIFNGGNDGFANISYLNGATDDGIETTLIGANESNLWTITGSNQGNVSNVTGTFFFNGVANLTGNYKDDYFRAEDGQNVTGVIDGGSGIEYIVDGGNESIQGEYRDILDYSLWTSDVTVDLKKAINLEEIDGSYVANSTLIGSDVATFWQITGANGGKLYYTDGTGEHAPDFFAFSTLQGGAAANTFQFTTGALTGNPSVIGGSNGAQTLDFSASSSSPIEFRVTNAANGNGSVRSPFSPFMNFSGITNLIGTGATGTGGDSLTSTQTGAHIWTMNGPDSGAYHANQSASSPAFSFSGIANLTGGSGNDTFSFGPNSSVSGSIAGGLGSNNVIDYSAFGANVSITPEVVGIALVGSASNIRGGGESGFSGIQSLIGTTGGAQTTLRGSESAVGTVFNLNGAGSGSEVINLLFTLNFSNVHNIIGGGQADTFNIGSSGSITGLLDGGAGSNTLSYSGYGSAVTVDLANGTANAIGSFANMTTLTGASAAHGTLIGANTGNLWTISGADSGNVNGIAFSNFKNLTGGTGNDSFSFTTSLLSTGSLNTGTITDAAGTNSLTIVSGGSFTISNTSVSYGSNTTTLAATFASANFTATGTGTHNFNITNWSAPNGVATLNGSTSGTDNLILSTAAPTTILTNTSLAVGSGMTPAVNFLLSNFENASLTNTDTVPTNSNVFDISGWTGTRTVSVTGSGSTGTTLVVKDNGNITVDGTTASATVTRDVGGNASLTNVTRIELTGTSAGGKTLALNGWNGTGSIKGSAVSADTFVYTGDNGNMSINSTTFSGPATLSLTNIYKARIQNTSSTSGPGVTINGNGFLDYGLGYLMLIGGAGDDTLRADSTNSIFMGGAGNDTLIGSSGWNILVGGTGTDTLTGNASAAKGTIFIGGYLSDRYFTEGSLLSTAQVNALNSVMAEWVSVDTFSLKVNRLLNGGPRNGVNLLNSFPTSSPGGNTGTVFDDGNANTFTNDAGRDWFMYGEYDSIVAFLASKDAKTKVYPQFPPI